jgi:hypothetical protein
MLNVLNQGQINKSPGVNLVASSGEYAETLTTQLQPRYYQNAYRGQTFLTAISNAAVTAYSGAAAGTPLLGLWNPSYNVKNLVLLQAAASVYTAAATTAVTVAFRLYGGPTAAITGTLVAPVNALTLIGVAGQGSIALASSNAANTGSSALTYICTIGSYYWASALEAQKTDPIIYDCAGAIVIPPGSMIALGGSVVPTTATFNAFLIWAEVPI